MVRLLSVYAIVGVAFAIVGALTASAQTPVETAQYGFSDVVVEIAEDAFIDWNAPNDPSFETERDFIKLLFANGASKGAEKALVGGKPALLRVTVTRFDILSTLELFFCCAVNEVAGTFELIDAATGDVVLGPTDLAFNHVGVGGVFAVMRSAEGGGQLDRIMHLIGQGAITWLTSTDSDDFELVDGPVGTAVNQP